VTAASTSGATKVLGSTIEKSGPTASRPLVTQPADFQQPKKSDSVRYILAAVGALLLLLNAIGALKVPMLSRPRRDD
jgi:hypothetical protein